MLFNFFSCRMMFFIVAFYTGLWTVRVPSIKDQIETDYLGIGYIFMSFGIEEKTTKYIDSIEFQSIEEEEISKKGRKKRSS